MQHLNEVREGDWVLVPNEGRITEGEVDKIGMEKAGVDIGGEIFWYEAKDMQPIPLTETWLFRLGFERSEAPVQDGEGQAYTHGPFTLKYRKRGNDNLINLSCHGEHDRDITDGLTVHELQHHYHGMTKVFIE
ncbi:hypothetical protein [Compostibacter hankyongensis]|uniref:Uncharacterized protein n=1 Tax=Compostibacter hankyongensis TaxID=1007089 RepID=A0ABP8FN00_9BACT